MYYAGWFVIVIVVVVVVVVAFLVINIYVFVCARTQNRVTLEDAIERLF